MDSAHIGTQACSLQSSLKLCKLYFCPSVFSMRLFVGSFAQTSHRCTLLYVLSLPLWTYTIRRDNLKCFETSYYSKIYAIWWFKWCLHFTLTSCSSAHTLQMKPLLHNTASGENTARLSLSLILDAFYTVKAVLVLWTRGGRYHSNRKAWQNDYSQVNSSKNWNSVFNSLSCCSRTSSTPLNVRAL